MPDTLAPYSGEWNFQKAAHLLRRSSYLTDKQSILNTVNLGLEDAVDLLLEDIDLPDPPLNPDYTDDPNTPIGETWVDNPYLNLDGFVGYRMNSLRSWTLEQMEKKQMNIREKLSIFWHNHFVIADVMDARYHYKYISTIRSHALGNFRELTKLMTIDLCMLRFLNGRDNSQESPNENYARELLELFTVGKGPLAAPGDYTTFTEQDVRSLARALTGWRDLGHNRADIPEVQVRFLTNRHDKDDKILSHRFNNAVIQNKEEDEYKEAIDILFTSDECAKNICRELYRWFLFYEINEEVETNIIEPLAELMIANDYEVKPVLRALLLSEHFHNDERLGCMIKNPMDFVLGMMNLFDFRYPNGLAASYNLRRRIFIVTSALQMQVFEPPSVSGWKAYFQEPTFYRSWLNTVTLPLRNEVIDRFIDGFNLGGMRFKLDVLRFMQTIDNPGDINVMLAELNALFFPKALSEDQLDALKRVLIPGLPDFEWAVEWSEYASDPDDPIKRDTMELKLQSLFRTLMIMPEFHLS